MSGTKVTIISTILLVGALFSIGMTDDASAVITLDGAIGGVEYANSILVDKSALVGGFYDPGFVTPLFGGGPVNCHDDWRLFWDSDATRIYFAADPLGAGSSCADAEIGVILLPVTGDPNIGEPLFFPVDDCTGTIFRLLAHNNYIALTCDFTGPPLAATLIAFGATDPPLSTETFVQLPVGAFITPIEWSNVRADLARAGDTTYAGNLQCLWFRASAFDSRGVDNAAGPGSRTIWIKFDPTTPNCSEEEPLPFEVVKTWTETDYNWDQICDANLDGIVDNPCITPLRDRNINNAFDNVLAATLDQDGDDKYLVDANVHPKTDKFQNTNPGAFFALTTVDVTDDVDGLIVWENYDECTDDGDGMLKLVSKKAARNVKVAIADPSGDITELTDDLYDDVGGSIIADIDSAHVEITDPIASGSTVYVLVKFQDNLKGVEFPGGDVDEMCDNSETVSKIGDLPEDGITVDAALRITNQE